MEVATEAAVAVADNRSTFGALNPHENTMDTQTTSALPEDDGSESAMKASIQAMSALIGQLQRREQVLEDLVRQQLQLLQNTASSADQRVTRVVENALPRLTQLSQQALTQTLQPAAERFNRQLVDADQTLEKATRRYAQAQHTLETTAMRRMWIGFVTVIVGSILCVGGAFYAVKSAQPVLAEAAQRRAEIAFLERVARANLVPCGEDRLCAELEKKGPRYGDRGQYRVVALRRPASE